MKKSVICIIGAIVLCATIFGIYWSATAQNRLINKEIERLKINIEESLSENDDKIYISSEVLELKDERFEKFLTEKFKEVAEKRSLYTLAGFIYEFFRKDYNSEEIKNILSKAFNEDFSTEEKLRFQDICKRELGSLYDGKVHLLEEDPVYEEHYYTSELIINKNTLSTYFDEQGVKKIHTTAGGGGYYSGKRNTSKHEVIGLKNSPLNENESITYLGDFRKERYWGVRLDNYYDEEKYDYEKYYFRDNYLDFNPFKYECIYSGKYLFAFSKEGILIHYDSIMEK